MQRKETREELTTTCRAPIGGPDVIQELYCDTFMDISTTDVPLIDVCSNTDMMELSPGEAVELLKSLESFKPSEPFTPTSVSNDVVTDSLSSSQQLPNKRKDKKNINPSTGKMRNPSRERLQLELAYLRNKVVEMESELQALHSERRLSLPTSTQSGARIWQRVAKRQAQKRHEAEVENKRLKTVLQGQVELAKQLEELLLQKPNVTVFREKENAPPHRLYKDDSNSMYELFLSELDVLYVQLDSVFSENGMEKFVNETHRDSYVKTRKNSDDVDELYLELQDVNVLPFELNRVSSAMWYAVKRQYHKNCYHTYQNIKERPDDTIAVQYRSPCKFKGTETWIDAMMVMRRYIERDRLVIVWRSVSRWDGLLSGVYTDETGWSVIKPLPNDSGTSLPRCIMHNCVYVVPKRVDFSPPQCEIGMLTNLVTDSYENDVVALSNMVEDLLLHETVQNDNFTTRGISSS